MGRKEIDRATRRRLYGEGRQEVISPMRRSSVIGILGGAAGEVFGLGLAAYGFTTNQEGILNAGAALTFLSGATEAISLIANVVGTKRSERTASPIVTQESTATESELSVK